MSGPRTFPPSAKTGAGKHKATKSSAVLLEENPARVKFVISPDPEHSVWIAYGTAAVKGEGVCIEGGAKFPYTEEDWLGEVTIIGDGTNEPEVAFIEV